MADTNKFFWTPRM